MATVREQSAALSSAREALGSDAPATEWIAGSMALMAGVPADSLARLRTARPRGARVIPLVDLTARQLSRALTTLSEG